MMTKKEFISQLTMLASRYADERLGDNNKLFASNQELREAMLEWEQKYHTTMAENKNLEEQNGILQQEAASLAALNEILSGELATLKKEDEQLTQACKNWQENYLLARRELTDTKGERDTYYQEKLDQGKIIANLAAEVVELKKELAETKERWLQQVEYADKYAAELVILEKELAEKETALSKAFAAAEERYEDFKKRSDGILATMGENLQRKQDQIEALTTWKEGTEKVLDYIEARAKEKQEKIDSLIGNNEILARTAYNFQAQLEALKQINSFQEHRIEVLSRKARKANKLRKKEQND